MGGDDAVLAGKKGIPFHNGLLRNHVHCRPTELSGVQRLGQGGFLYEGATGGVQQDGAVFHLGDGPGIDDACCLREQGTVEGHHVGLCQKSIQVHIGADLLPCLAPAPVVGQDLHAEGTGQLSYSLADAAEADDAHGFSGQLHLGSQPVGEAAVFGPAAPVDILIVEPHLVAQLQQQGHGELGHGGGAVGGHVGYGDISPGAGGAVHHVVAGGLDADQADAGAGRQKGLGDGHLVDEYNFGVPDPGNGLFFRVRPVVDGDLSKLVQAVVAQVSGVQGVAVQNHKLHKVASFNRSEIFMISLYWKKHHS